MNNKNYKSELLKFLDFTKIFNYTTTINDNSILIQKRPFFSIRLEELETNIYHISIFTKTISCDIDGDRTDLHELLPIFAMFFLRCNLKYNFSMINVINEMTNDNEISASYIFPTQPNNGIFKINNKSSFKSLEEFFVSLIYSLEKLNIIIDITCKDQFQYTWDDKELKIWVEKIKNSLNTNYSGIYIKRINPTYFYYRNIKQKISIVKSQHITENLTDLFKIGYNYKKVEGINSKLFIDEPIKNVVYENNLNKVKRILKKIEGYNSSNIIPFDNFSILLGKEHFIIFSNNGGVMSFIDEKEKIRKRYLEHTFNLFYELPMEWNIQSNNQSALFEDMILELLEIENGIISVKKVAPTNQPDNGRDLIATYTNDFINNDVEIVDNFGKVIQKKLIVQCKTKYKASKKQSVGKSDVQDVVDTLYNYTSNGYLLVVNTQITRDLTEFLENIKLKHKFDITWWHKNDIEKRLREHPEIINKYKDIVKYSSS